MSERRIPGVLLVIVHKGQTLLRKAYGLSHLELPVPAKPEHLYGSGSTGKMFTATAICQLAAAGKLETSDLISRHLPEAPAAWAGITIDHLMRHRSGLRDYTGVPEFQIAIDWSDRAFIDTASAWALEFPAGTKFSYSNTGYVLLGFIIARASGIPFHEYMKRNVFDAAGMRTAQIDDSLAILTGRAQGYEADEAGNLARPLPVSRSVNRFADGSILFNADDLISWESAIVHNRLISPQAQHAIETATPLNDGFMPIENYGAGWATRIVRGHRLVSHGGLWNGFGAWIGRWADDGLAITACTNLDRGGAYEWAPRIAALIDPDLAPYEPIPDDALEQTMRDRNRLEKHLAGGYMSDGSSAQQRAHAIERGPLLASEQFVLFAVEGVERVYGFGEHLEWIARQDLEGRISLSAS